MSFLYGVMSAMKLAMQITYSQRYRMAGFEPGSSVMVRVIGDRCLLFMKSFNSNN